MSLHQRKQLASISLRSLVEKAGLEWDVDGPIAKMTIKEKEAVVRLVEKLEVSSVLPEVFTVVQKCLALMQIYILQDMNLKQLSGEIGAKRAKECFDEYDRIYSLMRKIERKK